MTTAPVPAGVAVVDDPDVAASMLAPARRRVLAALAEPGSATTVARRLGLTRQQVNYHLRALEEQGLVELVEERPRRGLTERVVRATAASYVVAPEALGELAVAPDRVDRLSSAYVIALGARLVSEVAALARGADDAGQSLATLGLDAEIRFASASDRAAFTQELVAAVTDLAARYHDESAPRGRRHRLVVAAHPLPAPPHDKPATRPEETA
ncbi:MAG: helix-turn-helix domain-containing protein [Nocardioidaceae bacterium]